MRLTPKQSVIIRQAAAAALGADVRVWLFGSRVHEDKRGDDIDLLVQPSGNGECKIDIVIEAPDVPRPMVQITLATGIRL